MKQDYRLRVKFWGVRGSTPTPQLENLVFGGNTPCVEVRLPSGEVFIFDAGTGARNLGLDLQAEKGGDVLGVNFFLTHFHWDHIQGIPFFAPLYEARNSVVFHSFRAAGGIEDMLRGQMQNPYFPVDFEFMAARKEFVDVSEEVIKMSGLTIHPFPLNHPQGAVGFRLEKDGAVVVYATDLEHGHPELDKVLREYSQNADILIYDAQYTPEEYQKHQGWGHSTWLEATRVASDAQVKHLVLFHHNPSHDDRTTQQLVEAARLHFESTAGAQEGSFLIL